MTHVSSLDYLDQSASYNVGLPAPNKARQRFYTSDEIDLSKVKRP